MSEIKWIETGVGSVRQFYPQAKQLRNSFDQIFKDPLSKPQGRFVWDAWNVPQQYSLLRSPITSFFSEEEVSDFLDHLSAWSQENLGLSSISYPWMSAYLDSHYQGLHTDAKHGPWAFVYSLTPHSFFKKYSGGESRIARPQAFRFFSSSFTHAAQEEKDFWIDIAPKFNQLTIFDPRRPHGVKRVEGPHDIRQARLVIHGWFSDPRPFFSGKVKSSVAQDWIEILSEEASKLLSNKAWSGLLPLRMNAQGKIELLHNQLIDFQREDSLKASEKKKFINELQTNLDLRPRPSNKLPKDFKLTLPLELV